MKILLESPGRDPQTAEVPEKDDFREGSNWVTASIEAAWAWLRYTGSREVTAKVRDDGERIATVSLEIHGE